MSDINNLSPTALRAAMQGGTEGWGQHGSEREHIRYSEPVAPRSRQRCHCGCKQRATHRGMANGVMLMGGCEMAIARWKAQ